MTSRFPSHLANPAEGMTRDSVKRMLAGRNGRCYNCGGRGGLMIQLTPTMLMCVGASWFRCLKRRGERRPGVLPPEWLPGHHPNTSLPFAKRGRGRLG